MGVVHESVEDRIGKPPAAEILVPVADRQLRGDKRGAGSVAFLDGFEQVLLLGLGKHGKSEVVDYDERSFRQPFQQPIVRALGARLDELCEQLITGAAGRDDIALLAVRVASEAVPPDTPSNSS